MHKHLEPKPTSSSAQHLRSGAHQGVPTISRIEREMARHLPARDRPRQIALLKAIEQRFARISARDATDTSRRGATVDRDVNNKMEYLI